MILITGGLYQGQDEYIKENYKSYFDLYAFVKENLSKGKSEEKIINEALSNDEEVFLAILIGAGLIPVDPFERNLREVYGRCTQAVAKKAERVMKFTCGIITYIK